MQVIVNISLKEGVLDPQGQAIARSLNDLGFQEVGEIRVGKRIVLEVDETDEARLHQRVAKMYDPFHPGVLRVLAQIAEMAGSAGKSVSICGEVAGDHWFTPILLGMGYRDLSMAPVFLPRVKLMLRSFSIEECRDIARRALALHSTSAVRKMVHSDVMPRWREQLRGSGGSAPEGAKTP